MPMEGKDKLTTVMLGMWSDINDHNHSAMEAPLL